MLSNSVYNYHHIYQTFVFLVTGLVIFLCVLLTVMSHSVMHCVIDVFAKPQSVEKVRLALLDILEPTRKEDGCLKYKLFQNMADQYQFTLIGAWESEDAFEDHLQSDHFRKADSGMKNDLSKATDVKRYKYLQTDPTKIGDTKTSSFCILI